MKCSRILHPIPAIFVAGGLIAIGGSAAAATIHTFKGPSVASRYGAVQVSIVVKGKKITNVKVSAHPGDPPSQAIEGHALPVLKSEVLKAQSAKIDVVSGATFTSTAYIASLKGALKKAHMK